MRVGVILAASGGQRNSFERNLSSHVSPAIKLMMWLNSGKYMALLSVLDDTGTSAFLGFDMKVTKLTGIEASEAAQIVVDTDLPRSLADIVGSTYTFQLRLKDFNFTANHQTFTISLIFPTRELAPMPTFPEGIQVPEAVTPGSDARLANTCKVEEQATTSDVSLPGHLAAAKEQVVLERMPRRKHV
ncbi:hypothetical protein Bca52824_093116 [Brassica carinata]|uniref:Uncharacterized protein n=1 Tax=Brassica carinata TaxID=52824 RepID=A0A8X7P6P7_BRACI|nr:hypothetical protein Bca52824_093116 [Brassica carinata]